VVDIALADFNAGAIDFTPVFVAEQFLVQQQNQHSQAQGDIALGLISVYRALGGGWQLRLAEHPGHSDAVVEDGSAVPEFVLTPRKAPPGP
jgi:outer membrane protein TolC